MPPPRATHFAQSAVRDAHQLVERVEQDRNGLMRIAVALLQTKLGDGAAHVLQIR
jgi:hypothetical protein